MWDTRKKEHINKVRLTKADIESGNMENAERWMNDGDGGSARNSTECTLGIDWIRVKLLDQNKTQHREKCLREWGQPKRSTKDEYH